LVPIVALEALPWRMDGAEQVGAEGFEVHTGQKKLHQKGLRIRFGDSEKEKRLHLIECNPFRQGNPASKPKE
jgi:hypothetical protein